MKSMIILLMSALLILNFTGAVMGASVEPMQINLKTGSAEVECGQVGTFDHAYKVDNPAENGVYNAGSGETITISNSDGYTFDWSVTPYPLGAVLVKAGSEKSCPGGDYLVYSYSDSSSDTNLGAPCDKQISHVTFCWNEGPVNVPEFPTLAFPVMMLVFVGALALFLKPKNP
ncbi:MAG: hypothetical protein QHG99_07015 [Methanomicrobiales archaeon]|jgi:hypothetical protein|nr:hypothetical protein [Methanomicrobiales archaeon]